MKKALPISVAILILIILVLIGLAPWVDGFLFKRHYLRLIAMINHDKRFKIDVLEYHWGWLHSTAKIHIKPIKHEALSFTVENNISHGPLVSSSVKNGMSMAYAEIKSVATPVLPSTLHSQGTIQMDTLATFDGQWLNKISSPSLVIPMASGASMTWQGVTGSVDLSADGGVVKQANTTLIIQSFVMQGSVENPFVGGVNIRDMAYQARLTRLPNGVWSGNTHLLIPAAAANIMGASVNAKGLNITNSFGASGASLFSANVQLTLDSLQIPYETMPMISPIKLSFAVNDLNLQAEADLLNYFNSMSANEIASAGMTNYTAKLLKIFTPTTNITESFSLGTPDGGVSSNGKVNWMHPISTTEDLFKNANVTLTLRAAIPLVDKLILQYVQQFTPPSLQPVASAKPAASQQFNQQVAQALQQGQITLEQSLSLIGWNDQQVTPDVFMRNVDQLKLQPAVAAQLKQAYQTAQANKEAPAVSPQQTKETMAKQLIDGWIQQGYIVTDNNDYVVTIANENGVTKINGKEMPSQLPLPNGPVIPH